MKIIRKLIKKPLFWIFIIALILRVYKLGYHPFGFHVDEVKVGWNSASILRTLRDDKNNFLPMYYDSFGDFRPTGIFYLTIPSIYFFGNNEFATRFPTALFGALMVIPIYLLANILNSGIKKNLFIGYTSAFLMAISPWAINLSRSTNEVVISTFFTLIALYYFIKLIKFKDKTSLVYFSISIVTSYFLYHSVRFLAPIIFLITLAFYYKESRNKLIQKHAWLCIVIVCLLTFLFGNTKEGLSRFGQVSIFKNIDTNYEIKRLSEENNSRSFVSLIYDNKVVVYFKAFINSYFQYYSGGFLVGSEAKPYRFATPGFGLISYIDLILVLLGIAQIIRGNKSLLPVLLLIIAPLPSAITSEDVPNLSRAFLMLPFLILISGIGFESLSHIPKRFVKIAYLCVLVLMAINFSYYLHMYYQHSISHRPFIKNYSGDSPTYRDIGTKELATKLDELKLKYEKIVITNFPDSPYPWYAYFSNKNPLEFNKTFSDKTNERVYENIIFSEDKCPSESALLKYSKKNILIVDSWECPFNSLITDGYPLKIVDSINRPDGTMVYTLLERDWKKPLVIKGVYY